MPRVPLFVYGSLLAPAVLRALLDREPSHLAAQLPDYRRTALRGQSFPAIVPAVGAVTAGALIRVDRRELRRLDAWEDDFFYRCSVSIRLADGDASSAQAYVLAPRHRHLVAARSWEPDDFTRHHAAACALHARRWRRDRNLSLRHTTAH
jgi:gamma-glutamylcyclotransferase (GGCT)/AIG2-like uncharacterized protein YtfP